MCQERSQRFVCVTARKNLYINGFKPIYSHSGDDSNEVPPVPIPNTEVKLVYARCSWVLTPQDKVVAGFHFKRTVVNNTTVLFIFNRFLNQSNNQKLHLSIWLKL